MDIESIDSEYFLRFSVLDNPGVLSRISGVLGKYSIGILSVIQKGRCDDGRGVPLIMMTHRANEKNVQQTALPIDAGLNLYKHGIKIKLSGRYFKLRD